MLAGAAQLRCDRPRADGVGRNGRRAGLDSARRRRGAHRRRVRAGFERDRRDRAGVVEPYGSSLRRVAAARRSAGDLGHPRGRRLGATRARRAATRTGRGAGAGRGVRARAGVDVRAATHQPSALPPFASAAFRERRLRHGFAHFHRARSSAVARRPNAPVRSRRSRAISPTSRPRRSSCRRFSTARSKARTRRRRPSASRWRTTSALGRRSRGHRGRRPSSGCSSSKRSNRLRRAVASRSRCAANATAWRFR